MVFLFNWFAPKIKLNVRLHVKHYKKVLSLRFQKGLTLSQFLGIQVKKITLLIYFNNKYLIKHDPYFFI